MHGKATTRCKYRITQITRVAESVREMFRLYMVPRMMGVCVRKLVTEGAVVFVVRLSSHKLKEVTWVLKGGT